jgi:hypothetical protein
MLSCLPRLRILSYVSVLVVCCSSLQLPRVEISRRQAVASFVAGGAVTLLSPSLVAHAATDDATITFRSGGFGREEYTNSIVASRDTNISPKEVYDTLAKLQKTENNGKRSRALDVGAGAGVSTQVLWDMGYRTIDALDWSGEAWRLNVEENGSCPPSVHFFELDDERFLQEWKRAGSERYDVIAFNFAVNRNKALAFSKELLKEDGILLAPINTQTDYWLKQVYTLIDASGKTLWTANDVGAWSVQFQPDVTQDTCQGVWCAPFNGFKKLRL